MAAVLRRFPLLGRPRPPCPALTERIQNLAHAADELDDAPADPLNDSAHILNMAALISSDCGLPDLARELCWRHIDLYLDSGSPLTTLQARHLLEPVINLARLALRARDTDHALQLLIDLFHAVRNRTELVLGERRLPLTDLAGTRAEFRKLQEWTWLQLVGDGVRALVLAGRWDDAVVHAQAYNGIGLHLMEGRQAKILASVIREDFGRAQAALKDSTPSQPWERPVAECLSVLSAGPDASVDAMITRFHEHRPVVGYAFFRAQLGLSVAALADRVDQDAAARVLSQNISEAIESGDGYVAREVLRFGETQSRATESQRSALSDLVARAGLGAGAIPGHLRQSLLESVDLAARSLRAVVSKPTTATKLPLR
ncbi:hypothetical protein D5S17_14625 [Pseudonocardiaceae bacterium YIM PH 21723]|nr:hypothetical protein D5S17_14625 [Pseudonocardiaceae bacterium YIM PH 21723]